MGGKKQREKFTPKPKSKQKNQNKGRDFLNKGPSHPLNPPPSPYLKKTIVKSPTKLVGPFRFTPSYLPSFK
jgi:hypothetical protein